jgi:hypothetical protein
MQVLVTRRSNDYMAHEVGHPETWECDRTPEEAVWRLCVRLQVDPGTVVMETNNGGYPTFKNTTGRKESPL